MLQSIRLKNFLSFGPEGEAVPLGALNILSGRTARGSPISSRESPCCSRCLRDLTRQSAKAAVYRKKGNPDEVRTKS